MKVKWLIENYESDNALYPLINEIKNQGMELQLIKYEPWESGTLNQYSNEDCVIFYGTLNLGNQIQKQKGWIPGVYCNRQNLSCVTYYSYWAKYLLNKDYIMLPLLEVQRRQDEIFEKFGIDNCIFIRPNSGAKTFTGQILKKEEINQQFKLFQNYTALPVDQIITIISSPKIIEAEWRFVVVDKKVITGSQYRKNNKLDIKRETEEGATLLAEQIANNEWQPDRAYTLDICKSNKEYHLLEVNSFSCSGLYKCDPSQIVSEVSRIALEEWEEYNEKEE